ncbi:isochorismatase family protein [bacterium]|nr:MAG: isochorismatase family protein [bacterium]
MIKENYLSHCDNKADKLIDEVYSVVKKHAFEFKFENSALLVIDMQNYFLMRDSHAYIPSASCILHPINKLVTDFKKRNCKIIFTKHSNTDEDAGMMKKWWNDVLKNDSRASIVENLDKSGAEILPKTQYDAFYNTRLEIILRENGIKQVVITGVTANLCCESTARSAFIRGFEVFFPVDCTAAYNEQLHLSTLHNLSHGFAHIVKSTDLLNPQTADE